MAGAEEVDEAARGDRVRAEVGDAVDRLGLRVDPVEDAPERRS